MCGFERFVVFGRILSKERDADIVWSGLDGDAALQSRVDRIRRRCEVGVGHLVIFFAADRSDEYAFAIDRDFQLMRPFQALHVAHDIAQQENPEVVLAVEREVVMDQESAARAQRQSFDVVVLCRDPAAVA